MKKLKLLALVLVCFALFAFSFTVSAQDISDGWYDNGDGTWSYYEYGGKLTDQFIYDDDAVYRVDANGVMLASAWYADEYDNRYYFGSDGKAYEDGVYQIGSNKYAFGYNGRQYINTGLDIYDYELEENFFYYAQDLDKGGALLTNDWKQAYQDFDNDSWYYFGSDAKAYKKGVYKIGANYYGFDDSARLNVDGLYDYYDESKQDSFTYYSQSLDYDGALLTNAWKEISTEWDGNHWYYFGADGIAYKSGAYKIGANYYGFNYDSTLNVDGLYGFYSKSKDTHLYYYSQDLDHDGALLTNAWKEIHTEWDDNYWSYFGADGIAYSDNSYWIKDAYYAFSDIQMIDDGEYYLERYDDELDEWVYIGVYRAKKGGKLYANQWYEDEDGDWYYYGAYGKAAYGLVKIGGKNYLFNEWGRMLTDQALTVSTSSGTKWYVADSDGNAYELFNNNWKQIGNDWYYVKSGELCQGDFYDIGGATYYFGWDGIMYADTRFCRSIYDDDDNYIGEYAYYAKPDGKIAKNEWVQPDRYNDAWYYFTADGTAHEDGFATIGGKLYYFESDGRAVANDIIESEDGLYFLYDDCVAVKANGWMESPYENYYDEAKWKYVLDGECLSNGIYEIGGKKYAFDEDGNLYSGGIYWDNEDNAYLATKTNADGSGGFICEEIGWQKANGDYVYVTGDATLFVGWFQDKYYLSPVMAYCSFERLDGKLYAFNIAGERKQVTTNGFYSLDSGSVYLENGKFLTDTWKYLNGGWRYFSSWGTMYSSGKFEIDGAYYYFDTNGKMFDKGWIMGTSYYDYGTWYYANSNGTLYTGKDSAGYLFDEYGNLQVNTLYCYKDVWYVTNHNGVAVASLKDNDWTWANGNWYYMDEGYPVFDDICTIKNKVYRFDEYGRMLSNTFSYSRYFGNDGYALTGWINLNNKWYYGDPEDNGYLCYDGVYEISGKKYFFKNRILQQNCTVFWWDELVTTDSEGRVLNRTDASNGWYYDHEDGYGEVFYYKDGEAYEGWLGDYYLNYGELATDDVIEDNDKYYYLKPNGLCARNGWIEDDEEWYFARKDGSLYYDEWLYTGGKWYYFSGYYMASNGIYTIDGEKYLFNKDGVYISKIPTGLKDGWQKLNGNWYFYMAGEMVTNRVIYDNGKWYYMDYEGVMVSNTFAGSDYGYEAYYYTSDGSRATYTGWKYLNGYWCYFNQDHTISLGWIYDGKNQYYQTEFYNEKTDKYIVRMVTGYQVIDDVLCNFGSDGIYRGVISSSGWHKYGSDWYYVQNGIAIRGDSEVKIGNAYYAFDYTGKMIANEVYDGNYYDASGKMVTAAGWRYVDNDWIYIGTDGYVIYKGICKIGGVEYCFDNGVWVK
ncbi:MAG: hypothetical protein J6J39_00445 [Clostridia bacterium]|nr:hypothetical protein [Clostridia bacterium]